MKNLRNKKISRSWQKKKRRGLSAGFRFDRKKKIKLLAGLVFIIFSLWQNKKKGKGYYLKPSKRTSNKKILLIAAAVLFLLLTAYFLLSSDYFAVKNIKISGNQSITQDEILKIVQSDFSKKIYGRIPGNNFFVLGTKGIDAKLKTAFLEIDSVDTHKKFPNGLTINIKEKNPALIWCRQSCYFVNDQGVAFLPANENDMTDQKRQFIKITEQTVIPEETDEEKNMINNSEKNNQATTAGTISVSSTTNKEGVSANPGDSGNAQTNSADAQAVSAVNISADLPDITINSQVSDEEFIKFTLDINNKMSYNSKLKVKYYKTKGTKTRELIAFTDKNTKLYFDTTKSAEKQVNNLNNILDNSVEKDKIDSLQYVYLKNEDRVFYK
jgi:cell division septal protein FtsQ